MTAKRKKPWALPKDHGEVLKLIKKLGFKDRSGLKVHVVEDDRVLVTDDERGAYTVFAIFNDEEKSVRIAEEDGWPI